jgi:prepilin-type N-terminal cleavage/methylation domain-containing protein
MTGQRGFTLAELLVGLAVLGLLLAGVVTLQRQGQQAYLMGAGRVEAQQTSRFAVEMMSRELRSARSMTSVGSCSSGTSDITFRNQDNTTTRYYFEDSRIRRSVAGVTTTLIAGVQAVTFRCFGADGATATSTAASVRSVQISVRTAPEDVYGTASPSFQQRVAESRVRLRNLL